MRKRTRSVHPTTSRHCARASLEDMSPLRSSSGCCGIRCTANVTQVLTSRVPLLTVSQGKKTGQSKEIAEQGKVKRDVYYEYAKESNLVAVAIYLLMLVGAQTAQIGEFTSTRSQLLHVVHLVHAVSLQRRTCSVLNKRAGRQPQGCATVR